VEKRNALTPMMLQDMLDACAGVPAEARAILLTGEGAVFCAGFDLKLCLDQPGTLESLLRGLSAVISHLRYTQPLPVVVAAHGAAIAGGCALLGAGDLVVTDANAKIGYPVLPLGISPAVSAAFLRRCITDGRARARLLDPTLIDGREAMRIGLALECLEQAGDVRARALDVARSLASKPPWAMAATRRWLGDLERRTVASEDRDADAARALSASLSIVESDEQREGLTRLLTRG
jgi:enoyl-CoA hydratase/carnithine racemase